jgi:hypothetical protein
MLPLIVRHARGCAIEETARFRTKYGEVRLAEEFRGEEDETRWEGRGVRVTQNRVPLGHGVRVQTYGITIDSRYSRTSVRSRPERSEPLARCRSDDRAPLDRTPHAKLASVGRSVRAFIR